MSDLRDLYQEVILDHYKRPRNFRRIEEGARHVEGNNPLCGDRLTVYAQVEDGVVKDLSFEGSGCAISTASASLMTEALKGKTPEEAEELFRKFHELVTGDHEQSPETEGLGKLAVFAGVREFPARVKCASLAWHTVRAALQGEETTVSTE
jgi:nitrogen fixation NifU-like protein